MTCGPPSPRHLLPRDRNGRRGRGERNEKEIEVEGRRRRSSFTMIQLLRRALGTQLYYRGVGPPEEKGGGVIKERTKTKGGIIIAVDYLIHKVHRQIRIRRV